MKILIPILLLIINNTIFAQQKLYDITAFGAIGNGKTINTKAVQKAVDDCNANGGGEVFIPAGIFMIGTVHLKSNISLHLQAGAILRGSPNLEDYEINKAEKPYENVHRGMFFTEDAENVTISGEGQIDGNGDVFFDLNTAKKIDSHAARFTRQKDNFRKVAPDAGIGDGPFVPKDRPYQVLVFSNCKRISLKDIFITKSPFWCILFADCDAVNVTGVRLWNNLLAPNADGIDIASCNNVTVSNCDIRAGDDAIAIVGYDHHFEVPGFKYLKHPSGNILISNCNLQSYSSGIRIGYFDQNSVTNIHVTNCNITNSSRGIGIFLRDEGSLQNMTFDNISIQTVLHTGDWWGNGEPIHISAIRGKENVKLGIIKNIKFTNIICKSENGMLIYGTPESVIQDVFFDNISFELTDSKLNDVAGGNVDLRGCLNDSAALFKRDIPGFLIQYANNITINNFKLEWTGTRMPFFTNGIEANHFSNLSIKNFIGSASPINSSATKVFVQDGIGLIIDDKKQVVQKEINNF